MKRLGRAFVIGAALAWSSVAHAGTGHFYMPAAMFTCLGVTCEKTTWDAITAGSTQPILSMTDANTSSANADFFYPASHTPDGISFTATVHYLQGTTGSQKYCWAVGASFLKDATTGAANLGAIDGTEGTLGSASGTFNSLAMYKVSATTTTFEGYDVVGATNCTTGGSGTCLNQPGKLSIARIPSTGACTPDGSTAIAFVAAVDVSWTTQ